MKRYKSCGISIRNVGEKTIRNFVCNEVIIDGINSINMLSTHKDISSGEEIYVVLVNVPMDKEFTRVELHYEFYNLLSEKYELEMIWMAYNINNEFCFCFDEFDIQKYAA